MRDSGYTGTVEVSGRMKTSTKIVLLILMVIVLIVSVFIVAKVYGLMLVFGK